MDLLFWGVFAFIALDLAFLRRRSPEIAARAFSCSPIRTAIFCSLFVFLMFIRLPVGSAERYIYALLIIFMTCLYITGRRRYKFLLRVAGPESAGANLVLISEILESFLLFVVGTFAGAVVYEWLARVYPTLKILLIRDMLFYVFSSILMFGLLTRLARQQQVLPLNAMLGLDRKGLGPVQLFFVPASVGIAWAILCSTVMAALPQTATPFSKVMASSAAVPWALLLFFVLAAFIAPVIEEIFFRGCMFAVVERLKGPIYAFVVVALTFAALHVKQYWGDVRIISMVGVLSFLLTFFRLRTGSVRPSIVLHLTFNAAMIMIPVGMAISGHPYMRYQITHEQLTLPQKEEMLLQSIKKTPHLSAAYNDLAWEYAQAQVKLDEALVLARKAVSLDPHMAAFKDTEAEVLFRMGKVDEAIAIETQLVEQNPGQAIYREQLKKFQGRH